MGGKREEGREQGSEILLARSPEVISEKKEGCFQTPGQRRDDLVLEHGKGKDKKKERVLSILHVRVGKVSVCSPFVKSYDRQWKTSTESASEKGEGKKGKGGKRISHYQLLGSTSFGQKGTSPNNSFTARMRDKKREKMNVAGRPILSSPRKHSWIETSLAIIGTSWEKSGSFGTVGTNIALTIVNMEWEEKKGKRKLYRCEAEKGVSHFFEEKGELSRNYNGKSVVLKEKGGRKTNLTSEEWCHLANRGKRTANFDPVFLAAVSLHARKKKRGGKGSHCSSAPYLYHLNAAGEKENRNHQQT